MMLYEESQKLEQRLIQEAVEALTQKPVKCTTLERIRLFTEADEWLDPDAPQPLKYGLGLGYVLDRIEQPIEPYDLILGRITEEVPDEEGEAFFQEMCVRYKRTAQPWDKGTQPFWVNDQGHTSFYWKDVVEYGLPGLKKRAEQTRDEAAARGDEKTRIYMEGAVLAYDAIQRYLRRYGEKAAQMGMTEAAQACAAAADRAPQTFREALQMLWAIMLIYCAMLAGNPTLTYGRMDLFLQPLYEKDIREGRLTREEAGLLILDFYSKNNLIMGRGEHQLSIGDEELSTGWQRNLNFDAPQYLCLGGSRPGGEACSACSDLTLLFAQQVVPQFKNPVIVFRYAPGTKEKHPQLWETLVDRMRRSASMMVYNEKQIISAYIKAGVHPEDAEQFEHYGCNWPNIPGMDGGGCGYIEDWCEITPEERAIIRGEGRTGAFWNGGLVSVFMETLKNLAAQEEAEAERLSIQDFYDRIEQEFSEAFESRLQQELCMRDILYRNRPGLLFYQDLFFRDTMKRGMDYFCGGCKYFTYINSYGGFASLVDCISAVDALCFRDKMLTLHQLYQACEADFEGFPAIHALCRNAPKLGSDDAFANEHGRKLLTMLTDATWRVAEKYRKFDRPDNKIIIRQSIETDTGHISLGKILGATPDGRKAGVPLSQNTQPAVGSASNGMTAMFRSLASLPFDRIMSGALNVTIQPRLFSGEQGLKLLASIVGTYFELGGLQTQISAVDVEELREAQRDPDAHRDLMVRVTGYSAVFVDMIKSAQDDIIRREELSF